MIYPDVDVQRWAEQHKIILESLNCKCGGEIKFVKAFAIKGYRGVESAPCSSCGEDSGAFKIVPVDEDKIAFWEGLRP